ncbi:MAG: DUF1501 domain-containing protein [Phycisphaeraceae bacterium]
MRPSRREFMYAGLIGGLGLTLPGLFEMQALAEQKDYATKKAECDSVIHIFLPGGMAAQETLDPKPLAPSQYRGPFSPINTNVTGIQLGSLMKQTAKIADKISIIRSMTHGEAAHERGTHNMFTGYRPSPAVKYPSFGSVVSHELGANGELPPYVAIPRQANEHAGSGYLSNKYGPFSIGDNPSKENFKVRDLSLPDDIDHKRFARRQAMLDAVDDHFRTLESSDALDAMDEFYSRAYTMISSTKAREAFNLRAEPEAVRNKYGKNPAGMRMLLARRLAEAGVRFVSTTLGGWDHHQNIHTAMTNQVPELDQAYAALISDLDERGMLDRTMVMLTTEFGRTPKINKDSGRDHFPRVFSVAMAGGGFAGGLAYGESDATSTAVADKPVSHADLATTVYNQLGIVADKELMAPGDRPIEIVDGGNVLSETLEREA